MRLYTNSVFDVFLFLGFRLDELSPQPQHPKN